MRKLALVFVLLFAPSCAGSIEWVTELDENDFPIIPELNVVPGGQAQTELELLAQGSHVDTYLISVTPDDESQATATVRPTTAVTEDGVPFPVTVTVTADAAATPGSTFVQVGATAEGDTEPTASLSVRVVIQ